MPEEVFWKKQQQFLVRVVCLFGEEMIRGEQSEHALLYQSQYELRSVFSLVMCSQRDSQVGVAVVGGVRCGLALLEGEEEEVHHL